MICRVSARNEDSGDGDTMGGLDVESVTVDSPCLATFGMVHQIVVLYGVQYRTELCRKVSTIQLHPDDCMVLHTLSFHILWTRIASSTMENVITLPYDHCSLLVLDRTDLIDSSLLEQYGRETKDGRTCGGLNRKKDQQLDFKVVL